MIFVQWHVRIENGCKLRCVRRADTEPFFGVFEMRMIHVQWIAGLFFCLIACAPCVRAQQPPVAQENWLSPEELKARAEKLLGEPPQTKRLLPDGRVWFDRDEQAVIVDGYIAQRQAQLEMFACPTGTKEHESVVAVFARSRFIHAALLAVGAKEGKPASFEPFVAASGTTVRVYALWYDKDGKRQATIAQKWVRRAGTDKPMQWDWVFAGSKIYKDDTTGQEMYLADGGELICVANFVTSTLDLSVRSDAANSGLVFDAFTENIPKRDTPVRLVLKLSDEAPFGADEVDKEAYPKYFDEKVPDDILKYLPDAEKVSTETPAQKPSRSPKPNESKKTNDSKANSGDNSKPHQTKPPASKDEKAPAKPAKPGS